MDYSLVKELRDAGFPVRKSCLCIDEVCIHVNYPTLEELIEACEVKDKFFQLQYVPSINLWIADSGAYKGLPELSGKTPEEAVARLWLALNKK